MSPSLKEKLDGCIIGQCLGDALGFPVEGYGPNDCSDFVMGKVATWFEGSEPTPQEWFGQYTDDSQLARELLISLVENQCFEPGDYAGRIARIFSENRIVGRGLATDRAARRLNEGVHWKQSGCPPPAAGNGTAMRAAPAGMVFRDFPKSLVAVSHEQSWITHQDPRCSAGSIAIAGAVAIALQSSAVVVPNFVATLSEWMRPFHPGFADLVLRLKEWVAMPPYDAVEVIAPAGRAEGHIESWPGISPFVVPSVLWSLYSFLKHPNDYWQAIATSISVGGDVDTTGAMTGAISGAYNGLNALPKHLVQSLNDQGSWTSVELLELAGRCHEMNVNP